MNKSDFHFRLLIIVAIILLASTLLNAVSMAEEEETKTLELSINDAILMALENNSAFKIELVKPTIRESRVIQENSLFDLGLSGNISTSSTKSESDPSSNRANLDVEFSKNLKSGGDIGVGFSSGKTSGEYSSSVDLSLTQPLSEGAGTNVALAALRKAELSTLSSKYELQGYAESLVSQVIRAYWNCALAERQLSIYEESLNLAKRQLDETMALIKVGKIAEIEKIAAEAELSLRQEALINARSNLQTNRLKMLRLINPSGGNYWKYDLIVKDSVSIPDTTINDLDSYIQSALDHRPDLKEASLLLEQGKLDVLTTKNGLLPAMDLFISLGMSGYSDSFSESVSDISMSNRDFQIGLRYSRFISDRNDRERYKQTVLSQQQNTESLENLKQLAIQDVGIAWIEVNRAKQQIDATAASRKLQEEVTRAETEKYRVGKSTSLLVAQAQRDLTASRINEIQSVIGYNNALIDLFRNEGTLLNLFGISYLDDNEN